MKFIYIRKYSVSPENLLTNPFHITNNNIVCLLERVKISQNKIIERLYSQVLKDPKIVFIVHS